MKQWLVYVLLLTLSLLASPLSGLAIPRDAISLYNVDIGNEARLSSDSIGALEKEMESDVERVMPAEASSRGIARERIRLSKDYTGNNGVAQLQML